MSVRTKFEELVDKLYPLEPGTVSCDAIYGKPFDMNYDCALNQILTSKGDRFTRDPFICMVRKRIADRNFPVTIFMRFARLLYNLFGDKAFHKMSWYSPPSPKFNDVKGIEEMLKCVEIDPDLPAITRIQIVLKPLDMPTNATVSC